MASTDLTTEYEATEDVSLKSVLAAAVKEMGGGPALGRIMGQQFTDTVNLADIPKNQRIAHKALVLRFSTFFANMLRDSDKLDLDAESLDKKKLSELQSEVTPLIVEWINSDQDYCRRLLRHVFDSNPEYVRSLAGEIVVERATPLISQEGDDVEFE